MMLLHLLQARWRMLRNSYRSGTGGGWRALALGMLGMLFALGIFWTSHWFFSQCLQVEPIGEVVVRRMLGLTLLVIFSLLTFSNLVGAFSTLYLAQDLQLLVPKPIPPYPLFTARFIETSVDASWMIVPFSLPIFVSAGLLFDAGPGYYAALAGVYVALTVIPTAVGIGLSLILASALSARRARHLFVFAGTLALAVLIFLFRNIQPERFMNPGQRAELLDVVQTMRGTDPGWLPSTWALDALWPHLGFGASLDTHPMALLLTTSAMIFFVCAWVFRALHPRAFSRAQEGMQIGTGAVTNARQRRTVPLDQVARRAARMKGRLGLGFGMLRKDALVFFRDTAQWSQLLILVSIVVIYVLNFKYIRVVGGTGLISETGLHFLNLALSGFVVVALAARFVFPAVSLEGRAFWMVRASPNSMFGFLKAKTRSWSYFLIIFGNVLMLTTHVFLNTSPVLSVASVLTISPLVAGLVALGVGLGARYPRFNTNNAAKIATGLGGVMFMLIGAAVLTMVVLASVAPTIAANRMINHDWFPSDHHLKLCVTSIALVYLVPLGVGRLALGIGSRHLERSDR